MTRNWYRSQVNFLLSKTHRGRMYVDNNKCSYEWAYDRLRSKQEINWIIRVMRSCYHIPLRRAKVRPRNNVLRIKEYSPNSPLN